MGKLKDFAAAIIFVLTLSVPFLSNGIANASALTNETFSGVSTVANAWISGGVGSAACLTSATNSAANSIPACSGGPYDTVSNGVLQLTPDTGASSGFAIYDTPVSTSEGLQIAFNMYQYGGNGADGISFFLINGTASPTEPGASGGGLGYSNDSTITPGIVGGYVGVGFDKFGNFSNPVYGTGGPGLESNTIAVRGSQASGYQYVTGVAAAGDLEGTTRTNSERQVLITISSSNIMTVAVNYGNGYVTELSDINLNTINGAGSLPASFKFGFAASTGGSYDTHDISNLVVNTDPPDVAVSSTHTGNFTQGSTGQFTLGVNNDAAATATQGDITVTDTLPSGLTPTSASGNGWSCTVSGQVVTCIRPGSGNDALNPGSSTPNITVDTAVLPNATTPLTNSVQVATINNGNPSPSATDQATVVPGTSDGIPSVTKEDGPNNGDANADGVPDVDQDNVSSFVDPVTGKYAVLDSTSNPNCTGNSDVSTDDSGGDLHDDSDYDYPAGLMDFTLNCTPGSTATVSMLYYSLTDSSNLILRKFDPITKSYSTISGATFSSVTIGGQQATKITYSITDNGPLDENSTAGIITDPAGPAVLETSSITPNTGYGMSLISSQFISAAVVFSVVSIGCGITLRRRSSITSRDI